MTINEDTGEKVMLNVSVTCTRALVLITEVLAPQIQLPWHRKTLQQLQAGKDTFEVVVSLSCLRTRSTEPPARVLPEQMPPAEMDEINGPILPPSNIASEEADTAISDSEDEEMVDHYTEENSEYIQPSIASSMPSRILGDVFHEMDKLERTISVKHSLLKHFKRAFSDTMLVPDKRDKQNVLAYLAKKGLKWDEV